MKRRGRRDRSGRWRSPRWWNPRTTPTRKASRKRWPTAPGTCSTSITPCSPRRNSNACASCSAISDGKAIWVSWKTAWTACTSAARRERATSSRKYSGKRRARRRAIWWKAGKGSRALAEMWRRAIFPALLAAGFAQLPAAGPASPVLRPDSFRNYIEAFNRNDDERNVNYVDDKSSREWLEKNIPLFECSDKDLEETYHFRWWTFRKHIKKTPGRFVVTEFLPPVPWAGKYNTISCAAGHHFYEGRWLRNREYLDDYARFWFKGGGGAPPVQFLGGRCACGAGQGHARSATPDRPSAGPCSELPRVGRDAPGFKWPVLADRRPGRHGDLDRRQRLSGDDQQLYVRRRRGDFRDRRLGRQEGPRQGVPREGRPRQRTGGEQIVG